MFTRLHCIRNIPSAFQLQCSNSTPVCSYRKLQGELFANSVWYSVFVSFCGKHLLLFPLVFEQHKLHACPKTTDSKLTSQTVNWGGFSSGGPVSPIECAEVSLGKILNPSLALTAVLAVCVVWVLHKDALYECVGKWVNGNKLYCKALRVVIKTIYHLHIPQTWSNNTLSCFWPAEESSLLFALFLFSTNFWPNNGGFRC